MDVGQRYIDLTFVISEEDGQYAAYCLELGTASCGDTLDEAVKNINDAVALDLNTLEDTGERARLFRERGIKIKVYRGAKRAVPVKRAVPRDAWATTQRVPLPI